VPLSSLQVEALQVLADARDPESYVAGSTPLNLLSPRYCADIDIFHDRAERIAARAFLFAKRPITGHPRRDSRKPSPNRGFNSDKAGLGCA
jgi:hypothetical protein